MTQQSEPTSIKQFKRTELEPSSALREELLEIWAEHPWNFIACGHIYTRDDDDKANPIKPFPNYDYLRILTHVWYVHKKLLIQKSRQMLASYTIALCYFWESLFFKSRTSHFLSRKAEDAQYSILRIKWAWESMPAWMREMFPKVHFNQTCSQMIVFHKPENQDNEDTIKRPHIEDSIIKAMSQDASSPRGRTPSGIFGDELAHLDPGRLTEMVRSALPSVQHGRFTGVSSVKGEQEWYRLFWGLQDNEASIPKIYPTTLKKGLLYFRNKRQFNCLILHHTADPKKQVDSEWYKQQRALFTDADWAQEMDMQTKGVSTKGVPYFASFNEGTHVKNLTFKPNEISMVIRGWDFGFNYPVVLYAILTSIGAVHVFGEMRGQNEIISDFAPKALSMTFTFFPRVATPHIGFERYVTGIHAKIVDYGDAEGKQRDSTSGKSDIEMLWEKFKTRVIPVGENIAKRNRRIHDYMVTYAKPDLPKLTIHP